MMTVMKLDKDKVLSVCPVFSWFSLIGFFAKTVEWIKFSKLSLGCQDFVGFFKNVIDEKHHDDDEKLIVGR